MGKGDKKTRRGKITMGSHGVSRPRKKSTGKVVAAPKVVKAAKAPKTETAKAAPKKAAKKAAKKAE